jgi:hypothetical protein
MNYNPNRTDHVADEVHEADVGARPAISRPKTKKQARGSSSLSTGLMALENPSRAGARPARSSTKTSSTSRGALSSSTGHFPGEDQTGIVGARPASEGSKTRPGSRGASLLGTDPKAFEDLVGRVGARPARSISKTGTATRGASLSTDHFHGEDQTDLVGARPASANANTVEAPRGDPSDNTASRGARPASMLSKSRGLTRGGNVIGDDHPLVEVQTGNVVADHQSKRPANVEAKTSVSPRGKIGGDQIVVENQIIYVAADHRYDGLGPLGDAVPAIIYNYRFFKDYEISEFRESNHALAICRRQCSGTKDERKAAALKLLERILKGEIGDECDQQLADVVNQFTALRKSAREWGTSTRSVWRPSPSNSPSRCSTFSRASKALACSRSQS